MSITRGKYTILKYPALGISDLHTVRVTDIFSNPKHGRIIRYKYNWPLTITKEITEKKFIKLKTTKLP